MGKGLDLAKEIADLCRDYRDVINKLYDRIDELKTENSNLRMIIDKSGDHDREYIKILETVTDILCRNMRHLDMTGSNAIFIFEDNGDDFKTLCDVLEIPMTGSEVKENED